MCLFGAKSCRGIYKGGGAMEQVQVEKIYCLRRNFDSAALANKFVTDDNGDYNNPVENFGGGDLSEVIYDSSQNGPKFFTCYNESYKCTTS